MVTHEEIKKAQDWLNEQRCVVHPGPIETIRVALDMLSAHITRKNDGLSDLLRSRR